jgi:hypothetical protein
MKSAASPWERFTRREFIKTSAAGTAAITLSMKSGLLRQALAGPTDKTLVIRVGGIPENPFVHGDNYHAGLDTVLNLFSACERPFYRSASTRDILTGPAGIIRADDVVVIKVNGQWCYRGATNTDVLRGLIQRIIEHPDGFTGEIVLVENGQGRGSFDCNQDPGDLGPGVHANAVDHAQSFNAIVSMFSPLVRISAYLLDAIQAVGVAESDQTRDGYVTFGMVTYPKITTPFGTKVNLRHGIWNGSSYEDRLRLISVPVLKDHSGAWVTGALKLSYGLLSMARAPVGTYHYTELGKATGTMWTAVRRADLHLMDAIYVVKYGGPYCGTYDETLAPRTATLLASVDPPALDVVGAKYVLYPATGSARHHPDNEGTLKSYLAQAEATIRGYGYASNSSESGIMVADGVRGALDMMAKKQREGTASEAEVQRLLQYYYTGAWVS